MVDQLLDPPVDAEPAGDSPRRPRTALWTAIAVGVLVAILVGILATRDPAGTRLARSPLVGQPAPDVDGRPLLNGDFSMTANRGRWVLVNFFATWCVPCRQEQPELVSFSRRHGAEGDAAVVSVVFKDQLRDVRRFFRERGGEWPVLDDPQGRIALDYGVAGIPESYLVDPNGFVVAKIVGGVRAGYLDDLIAGVEAQRSGARGGG